MRRPGRTLLPLLETTTVRISHLEIDPIHQVATTTAGEISTRIQGTRIRDHKLVQADPQIREIMIEDHLGVIRDRAQTHGEILQAARVEVQDHRIQAAHAARLRHDRATLHRRDLAVLHDQAAHHVLQAAAEAVHLDLESDKHLSNH